MEVFVVPTTADSQIQRVAKQPSCGSCVAWVVGLAALICCGLALGGFVLPNAFDRDATFQLPTPAAMEVGSELVYYGPSEAAEPIAPIVNNAQPETKSWPKLGDPTTIGPLPSGAAYDLAKQIDRRIDDALAKADIS